MLKKILAGLLMSMGVLVGGAFANTGPQNAYVVLFTFPDLPNLTITCDPTEMGDLVFNQYATWMAAESRGLETIVQGAAVLGPFQLPHPFSYYRCTHFCGSVYYADGCDEIMQQDAIKTAREQGGIPVTQGDLNVFGYNGMVGGVTGSNGVIFGGCTIPPGCPGSPAMLTLQTLKHEGGHREGLKHSGNWFCTAGGTFQDVGPDLHDTTAGGCAGTRYGLFDPMGSASGDPHFSTYMRWRLGWTVPSNIRVVQGSASGVALTRADIQTDEVQEVRIPVAPDRFYSVEYRQNDGVVVWFVGSPPGSYIMLPDDEIIDVNFGLPLTPTNNFYDPYRGLTISRTGINATTASIDITFTNSPTGSSNGKRKSRVIAPGD